MKTFHEIVEAIEAETIKRTSFHIFYSTFFNFFLNFKLKQAIKIMNKAPSAYMKLLGGRLEASDLKCQIGLDLLKPIYKRSKHI